MHFFRFKKTAQKFKLEPSGMLLQGQNCVSQRLIAFMQQKALSLELHYYDSAPNSAERPMLLLHGNSLCCKVFRPQILHYAKTRRVIAIDLLGHGKSSKINAIQGLSQAEIEWIAAEFYKPEAMIAGLIQLLRSLKTEPLDLIGFSLGGHLAYGMAIDSPDLIASITSIAAPPVRFSADGFRQGFKPWFTETLLPTWINDPKPYSEAEADQVMQQIALADPGRVFSKAMQKADPLMRKYLFADLEDYDADKYTTGPLDPIALLANSRIPICLMIGEDDAGICIEPYQAVTTASDSSSVVVAIFKAAGHALMHSAAMEFQARLEQFLLQAATTTIRARL